MSKFAPPVNRNMVELDRSFFKKEVPLMAAFFPKPQYLGKFVKECQLDILYVQSVKHIIPMDDSKAVLLRDGVKEVKDLAPKTQEKFHEFGIVLKPYTLHLDYSFWKTDEILKSILPEELLDDIPGGFSQAGHLAHLNLRDEYKPYGKLIANTIANKFRTFPLELLAGEENYIVEQLESGCRFRFDFSQVYWNSRLSTEHERIISKFKPASKKEVIVLANDLNPEMDPFIQPYNLDGREFIEQAPKLVSLEDNKFERQVTVIKTEIPKFYHHFVMNLPDSALTFLDAFIGLYADSLR
ncbi:tRNA (guanine(37)-N1)-methyltransferase [Candida viswanathii]|uniref:tRNA (Guanine(37)-N1)-methyltransferase n=1 Tax=Candida viswanathii TaxID=5486 RepID=A0A367Y3B4_9ASCO|nr:tRNA (guanine(37)-N1)-methyltransferase [Candida viswanathii]